MAIRRIQTENAREEQWRLLSQFSYQDNINRYIGDKGFPPPSPDFVEYVAGSIRQAHAYFMNAQSATIDIAPLLLYYGATTLLAAVFSLVTGGTPTISGHGLRLDLPSTPRPGIGEVEVETFLTTTGAFAVFAALFSPNSRVIRTRWKIAELFGSLPDLKNDFDRYYSAAVGYTVPVETEQDGDTLVDRVRRAELRGYSHPAQTLAGADRYAAAYLPPQAMAGGTIVMRPRLSAIDIGSYSIVGTKYLLLPHHKNGVDITLNQPIVMLLGLFGLGHLTRYHPDYWNAVVRNVTSSEMALVERFLTIVARFLPNLMLNVLYGERIQFAFGGVSD